MVKNLERSGQSEEVKSNLQAVSPHRSPELVLISEMEMF